MPGISDIKLIRTDLNDLLSFKMMGQYLQVDNKVAKELYILQRSVR